MGMDTDAHVEEVTASFSDVDYRLYDRYGGGNLTVDEEGALFVFKRLYKLLDDELVAEVVEDG